MIVLIFLAAVLFGFAVQSLLVRRKFYKFSEKIPSPPSFGLLGHAPYFLGKNEEGSSRILWYFKPIKWMQKWNCVAIPGRLKMLHDLCLEHNSYTKLWLGPAIIWILVNEPRSIQKILLSSLCLEKPFFYKFLRLENGLISAKCKVAIYKDAKKSHIHNINL